MHAEAIPMTEYRPEVFEEQMYNPAAEAANIEQPSVWSRVKMAAGRLALAGVAALGIATTTEAVDPAPAEAASQDYGDHLSGQLPHHTRCAQDGRPVVTKDVNLTDWGLSIGTNGSGISAGSSTKVGEISLVYSPSCNTTWTHLKTDQRTGLNTIGIRQDTGYVQTRRFARATNSPAVSVNSPMIYDHGNHYRAFVQGQDGPVPVEPGTYYTRVK